MSLYETIQDFPVDVCITGCRLSALNREGVVEVVEKVGFSQVLRGQGWAIELDFLPMDRDEAAAMESFLLSLRAGSGQFRMGDPYQSLPLGAASGSPVTSAATAGSESLDVTGFDISVTGQLLANDKIQIGDHLYSVLADVDSDGSGDATISLWPPLREDYADSTAVITENARGVFALTEGVTFSRDVIEMHGVSFSAREVRV